jgi:hypothetical protein
MGRIRRCDWRCHSAQGNRCGCWCGSYFHGPAGLVNREALRNAGTAEEKNRLLEAHGFKSGQTAYLEQTPLPLEKTGAEYKIPREIRPENSHT